MVEFGDELVLESLKIPWLIWIQLLVMFLLLLLLCSFTSSSSYAAAAAADAAPSSSSSSPSSSSTPPLDSRGSRSRKQFLVHGAHQVGESQSVKGFITTSASRRVAVEEDVTEGENSSHSYMNRHPCSLIRLARIAFLKCLGLDFASESSSFKRHRR